MAGLSNVIKGVSAETEKGHTVVFEEILAAVRREIQSAIDTVCRKMDTQASVTQNACKQAFTAHAERIVNIENCVSKFMSETVEKVHGLEIEVAKIASFVHENGEDEPMSEEGVDWETSPPTPPECNDGSHAQGPNGPARGPSASAGGASWTDSGSTPISMPTFRLRPAGGKSGAWYGPDGFFLFTGNDTKSSDISKQTRV